MAKSGRREHWLITCTRASRVGARSAGIARSGAEFRRAMLGTEPVFLTFSKHGDRLSRPNGQRRNAVCVGQASKVPPDQRPSGSQCG
jgi:hypothetical protein